ncbi:hypothetical protein OG756_20490 [Streptomyces sp. NBC_01310]|uniref:hypothetical protein n=1 Tax=Streptomyces sp. NBC_01310 TaxID=2903820 RepID=UPI0035B5FED7|nr:hypothetical protein OG756_20490 [Streptomyces sp. NBC_01310]
MSTELLSRSRRPMGGRDSSAAAPAWCRAGRMQLWSERGTVMRIAWSTLPLAASS